MSSEHPWVSCLMPTADRREFVPAAIRCYQAQTYPYRELVILDDGAKPVEDLVPRDDASIRYIRHTQRLCTGAKRNLITAYAACDLLANFDDDDFSHPERLASQVALMRETGAPLVGYRRLLFWDTLSLQAKVYDGSPGYACGTSFMYTRAYWRARPWAEIQEASDNLFLKAAGSRLISVDGGQMMVARIHTRHTSPKRNIRRTISASELPEEFWENERYRLGRKAA